MIANLTRTSQMYFTRVCLPKLQQIAYLYERSHNEFFFFGLLKNRTTPMNSSQRLHLTMIIGRHQQSISRYAYFLTPWRQFAAICTSKRPCLSNFGQSRHEGRIYVGRVAFPFFHLFSEPHSMERCHMVLPLRTRMGAP